MPRITTEFEFISEVVNPTRYWLVSLTTVVGTPITLKLRSPSREEALNLAGFASVTHPVVLDELLPCETDNHLIYEMRRGQ